MTQPVTPRTREDRIWLTLTEPRTVAEVQAHLLRWEPSSTISATLCQMVKDGTATAERVNSRRSIYSRAGEMLPSAAAKAKRAARPRRLTWREKAQVLREALEQAVDAVGEFETERARRWRDALERTGDTR